MPVVGDGERVTAGLVSVSMRERLGGGVFARPEDEDAAGVGDGGGLGGEAGGDELLGMDEVGGEEEVCGAPFWICCASVAEEPKEATISTPVACS